jgi:hypothetical protein
VYDWASCSSVSYAEGAKSSLCNSAGEKMSGPAGSGIQGKNIFDTNFLEDEPILEELDISSSRQVPSHEVRPLLIVGQQARQCPNVRS